MVTTSSLGFPRVGVQRELKKTIEAYWKGAASEADLQDTARTLRLRHWTMQKEAGITHIPSNDFSFYDHVLDTCALLGTVPPRYNWRGGNIDSQTYFAMARGNAQVTAMDMSKWFDTNYHYIVPELQKGQTFTLSSNKPFDEYQEAKAAGIETRPVLVGPMTFLIIAKKTADFTDCRCTLVPGIVAVYIEALKKLQSLGARFVQIDEPALVLDLEDRYKDAYKTAYKMIRAAVPDLNIIITTYFDGLRDNTDLAVSLPVNGLHIDLKRAPDQLESVLPKLPADKILSLGLIDGRNIWKNDLRASLDVAEKAVKALGKDRVIVSTSCSLLHTPNDLDQETTLDPQIKSWMAFARQKLAEVATIAKGLNEGRGAIAEALKASDAVAQDRKTSARIHNQAVQAAIKAITPAMASRQSPFPVRRIKQQAALKLPTFPTTSIGSFPQTENIRKARADFKKGSIETAAYETAMKKEIEHVVRFQEKIDMDVLVHGEAERNDMVEYFGEQLEGFTFTRNGWVQSYGSRCVKPPVIFGDVSRPAPMTVKWSSYAQSLTAKPMKGMLTGPITILQWSFVRDDQPRSQTARQIALAIRDEVSDLEKAGIRVIQIDEPAIREGLPLRRADWKTYLAWAVEAFKLSSCSVKDETQIHTHMCYSEFNDIIDSVGAMDADVISIETSRSQMELLNAFVSYKYPNEIGPGVWDIHSPRVPSAEEMTGLLEKAEKVIPSDQLWVNPDCGLKTRGWAEVEPSLTNLVKAAKGLREKRKKAAA
ncbi:MAG: 5-methyltetrahydropteroyltriglutamate--homocysteine S-methyltransferase [Micavibrio aeruginosavorus]|uniref:5-methyltetrahydropteroyltriglutamate--homocysteine methyltransferase n=1 Tax=Micavibrio aeruginosavorus TaxID=349221 RepID=A0A7T5R319_9BACT|nr:MAG: 5-methyltetrahydropteroyltriglutamate--homocysteine S-methyltransferase [Micavibrio aeruginosavorus]